MDMQIKPVKVSYRSMTEHDIDAAHRLSQQVRWPHQLGDWQFVKQLGSGFVAEVDGKLIGTSMCWNHGADYASLGMVIVSPDWQGMGIGRELANRSIAEIGPRNVLLHTTQSGQPLYQALGFKVHDTVHQHQGTVFNSTLVALPKGERIRPLGARDLVKLAELGSRAVGMPRAKLLSALYDKAECVVIDRDGELAGCAMLRKFGHGYAIGPVIADTPEHAKALIAHWTGTYAGSFVRVDVSAAGGLGSWLDQLGLTRVDTVATMVRGRAPQPEGSMRQFAIINQAVG
jgi:predicted N-acetyltransferase YhbS